MSAYARGYASEVGSTDADGGYRGYMQAFAHVRNQPECAQVGVAAKSRDQSLQPAVAKGIVTKTAV